MTKSPTERFTNRAIYRHLIKIAQLKELAGHNVFMVRAYKNAAIAVAALQEDVSDLSSLTEIPGIGAGISSEIEEFVKFGYTEKERKLQSETEAAIDKGFLLGDAEHVAKQVATIITVNADCPVYIAGSVRRGKPYVTDIDLVVYNPNHEDLKRVLEYADMEVLYGGDKRIRFECDGIEGDLRVCFDAKHIPYHMLMCTGSASLNIMMRGVAKSKGYLLNEYGITYKSSGDDFKPLPTTEREIFEFLGVPYLEPEFR